jgi:[ribosomal protein S5]-alanine N-acetyltransferase
MIWIKGKKVSLRSLTKTDANEMYSNLKNEIYFRVTGIPTYKNLKQGYQYIRRSHAARKKGTDQIFAVVDTKTGIFYGMLGLHQLKTNHQNGEIGYWVAKNYWGQGIATAAVELALKFAFVSLKLHRVYANVFPYNQASMAVLKRNGFKREGILREHFKLRNQYLDNIVFGILKKEFLAQQKGP